jgi:hypothetical protein
MEQEKGMEERPATPASYEFPPLSRLHFFSPQNQGGIADYLAHLSRKPCGNGIGSGRRKRPTC